MKDLKRLLSLCLALILTWSLLPMPRAKAAGQSLSALQSQFPGGSYWNHRTSSGNNPNGYTWYACDHGRGDRNGDGVYTDCNSFYGGWQCWAFARKMAALAYDANVMNWSFTYDLDALKAGDIVQFGTPETGKGHTVWVTRVTDTTVTIADCNYNGTCMIRWNVTLSRESFSRWYAPSGNVYRFSYIVSAPYAISEPATLTFHGCGGQVSQQTLSVDEGFSAGVMPTAALDGYDFVGWFTADGTQVASKTIIGGDMELYARWQDARHGVIFDTQGGTLPQAASVVEVAGVDVSPAETGVTVLTGYGEALLPQDAAVTAVDQTGQIVPGDAIPEGGFVVLNGDLPERGWVHMDYALGQLRVYDTYEGYVAGEKVITPGGVYGDLPTPQREGWFFAGWYDDQGQRITWDSPVVRDTVLTAAWTETPVPVAQGTWNGNTYTVYDCPMTWEEAQALCQDLGGQLVTLADVEEQALVTELIQSGCAAGYYCGTTPLALRRDGSVEQLEQTPAIVEGYGFVCRQPSGEADHVHSFDHCYLSLLPTDSRTGRLVEWCVCGQTNQRTLPVLSDEDYTAGEGVDATCTTPGWRSDTFLGFADGSWADLTLRSYLPAPGHTELLENDRLPTSYQDGYYKWTCTRCGESRIQVLPAGEALAPFGDVDARRFYYWPVVWAVEWKITAGMEADAFWPEDSCTRGQVVTFLWRALGCPEPAGDDHPFTDLDPEAFYYKAVLWAVEQGITNGMEATLFDPEGTVTRGQFVTFLWRAAGKMEAQGDHPFVDVEANTFCYTAVRWAVEQGITNGMDETHFEPEGGCIRGQVVTFLYRYFG